MNHPRVRRQWGRTLDGLFHSALYRDRVASVLLHQVDNTPVTISCLCAITGIPPTRIESVLQQVRQRLDQSPAPFVLHQNNAGVRIQYIRPRSRTCQAERSVISVLPRIK